MAEIPDNNSKRSRVEPVFGWLRDSRDEGWPARLVELTQGLTATIQPGGLVDLQFEEEVHVAPSCERLAWMIRNAERLAPIDGRRWQAYRSRVIDSPARDAALEKLDRGERDGISRLLILEGPSHADCLVECENAVIWIEGKRNDWISPSTSWDVTRDQLARNLEAASLLAREQSKDYCLIICHEHALKHHEQLLIEGYRAGTWTGGWPHLSPGVRRDLGQRIGTLAWSTIVGEWPAMRQLAALSDLVLA